MPPPTGSDGTTDGDRETTGRWQELHSTICEANGGCYRLSWLEVDLESYDGGYFCWQTGTDGMGACNQGTCERTPVCLEVGASVTMPSGISTLSSMCGPTAASASPVPVPSGSCTAIYRDITDATGTVIDREFVRWSYPSSQPRQVDQGTNWHLRNNSLALEYWGDMTAHYA